jgi:hypothetical protein
MHTVVIPLLLLDSGKESVCDLVELVGLVMVVGGGAVREGDILGPCLNRAGVGMLQSAGDDGQDGKDAGCF